MATLETVAALDGALCEQRWSSWRAPDAGVVALLITSTGTETGREHADQPAGHRIAWLARRYRPAVVYGTALSSVGRTPLDAALRAIAEIRDDGPFLGDAQTPLAAAGPRTDPLPAVGALITSAQAAGLRRGARVVMRARIGRPHETLPGVWWFGNGRPAPPGLTKLRLRTPEHPLPRAALVLDCPAARPPEALVVGGPPTPRTPDGLPADQVTLVRWLGAHLYTEGWHARACAAYLAAHGWAPPALPARRPLTVVDGVVREAPAVRLGSGAGREALRAFLANLDFYATGELVVHLPDGGEPIRMRGVLPLDGRPWITSAQAARIRAYRARRLPPPGRCPPARAGERTAPPCPGSDADGQSDEHVGRHADRRPPGPPR
jgi:hypothetical protein